jgi:hypothetical protein
LTAHPLLLLVSKAFYRAEREKIGQPRVIIELREERHMNLVNQKYVAIEKERRFVVALSLAWAVAVVAGMIYLVQYRDTPGLAAPRADWPAESRLALNQDGDTLVMIAHPRCPCTKASVAELSRMMAAAQGKLSAYVVFVKPEGLSVDWEKTDLWASAAAIPGVSVMVDQNGVEAENFQAATSGQSMLFDNKGRLLFSGGITGSRGHEGDNDGKSAVLSLAETGKAEKNATPVYGCPLFAKEQGLVGQARKSEEKNVPHRQ